MRNMNDQTRRDPSRSVRAKRATIDRKRARAAKHATQGRKAR